MKALLKITSSPNLTGWLLVATLGAAGLIVVGALLAVML
jgi:hypothetical protein